MGAEKGTAMSQDNDNTIPGQEEASIDLLRDAIEKLSELKKDPVVYDLQKRFVSKRFGVGLKALDDSVKKLQEERKEREDRLREEQQEEYERSVLPCSLETPVPEGASVIDMKDILKDVSKSSGPKTYDGPVIEVSPFLARVSGQAWDVLQGANAQSPEFFRFGNELVRVGHDKHGVHLKPQNVDRLRHALGRLATWVKTDGDGNQKAVLPQEVFLRDMLVDPKPPLPEIEQVASVPVLTAQGKILSRNGYDPESRILLDTVIEVGTLPMHPTGGEIRKASDLIREPLADFPFEKEADLTNAVALFLLGFVRHAIDGPTPNHMIDAPVPGTGKTLLAETLLSPAHGANKGIVTAAHDDDEWRKRLTAQLQEGRPVINIDNIKRPLDSGTLAAALTATVWEDRRLGSTEMVRVPVRCTWVTTGNNVSLSTELARRTVRIRMDPKVETPEDRSGFKHPDLSKWVQEHRADLVRAALTLISAWIEKGWPKPSVSPLGSFEAWTHVIGGILEVGGFPDFLGNRKALYSEADFEGQSWRAFVSAWWEKFGNNPVKVSDLYEIAHGIEGLPLGTGNDQARRTALGKRLSAQRDRIILGKRIVNSGTGHGGASLWKLFSPREDLTSPLSPTSPEQERERPGDGEVLVRYGDPQTTTSPQENGSDYDFGDDGGVGEVKNHLLEPVSVPFNL